MPVAEIAFVALWFLGIGAFVANILVLRRAGYRMRERPPTDRPAATEDGIWAVSFRGQVRIGSRSAASPVGRLRANPEWVELRGFMETVWIRRSDVGAVTLVRGVFLPKGIMFRSESGVFDGVFFGRLRIRRVLDSLAGLGWPTPVVTPALSEPQG